MSGIRFNHSTKEIEMAASKSFIASYFNKVQNLLVERFGEKTKMAVSRITNISQKPASGGKSQEAPLNAGAKRHELSGVSLGSPQVASAIPGIPFALEANRPPLRKYIRKEGIPGNQRIVVQVAEQKPKEISLASVKEKFGLAESKGGETIRDAEKLGRIRRAMNASYPY